MNNERYNQIIDEAYVNYVTKLAKTSYLSLRERLEVEEFISLIKQSKEFSERWGLKIEERELSESEIWDYIHKNDIKIKHQHAVLYGHEVGSELRSSFVQTLKENYNIPNKLITVTYKDEKTEIYE